MGRSSAPLISVCVPVVRDADFVEATVRSVLGQDGDGWELIASVQPGSSAAVKERLKDLLADGRVKLVDTGAGAGVWTALNDAAALAAAPWIKPLLPGDELAGGALAALSECAAAHDDLVLIACGQRQITDDGVEIGAAAPSIASAAPEQGSFTARHSLLALENHYGGPSAVMYRRACAAEGFDWRLFLYADWNLWLKVSLFGKVAAIADPLCATRIYRRTPQANIDLESLVGLRDLIAIRDGFADFMETQGVARQDWHQIVRRRIRQEFGRLVDERGLDAGAARHALEIRLEEVSPAGCQELCRAYCDLAYESLTLLREEQAEDRRDVVVIDKQTVEDLAQARQTIENMEKSVSWRLTEPLRKVRAIIGGG